MPEKLIFVSHSSADADLAQKLVFAVERALKISARQILCSSVEGYRLEGGAHTSVTLREAILSTPVFAAILTPQSLVSSYVLFELGARWGNALKIWPLLAGGATAPDVPDPLKELNLLSLAVADQVVQFIEEIAQALGVRLEPYATFRPVVNELAERAATVSASPVRSVSQKANPRDIREIALMKMKAMLEGTSSEYVSSLATAAGISLEDAQDLLRHDPDVIFIGGSRVPRARLLR